MNVEKYLVEYLLIVMCLAAAFADPISAQTVDCEGTIRAWSYDVSMRSYMATHTCSCPNSNRQPVCVSNEQPSQPADDQPTRPTNVDNSAAVAAARAEAARIEAARIEAERARAEAERLRREKEFLETKRLLIASLRSGKGGTTVAANPLGLKPGTTQMPSSAGTLFASQTERPEPMNDGGKLASESTAATIKHGLVGGTTWTFGFKRPSANCSVECKAEVDRQMYSQFLKYCAQQSDPQKCVKDGMPFTPDLYDMVVSMGSYNTAIEDLATRVLFDSVTYGEFSRTHAVMFASLKGRSFDTLDCHSNGAMLCLAALRSGDTTAKEVRLFGPQINPAAARIWQDLAIQKGIKITVHINSGDPVPAASWALGAPEKPLTNAGNKLWLVGKVANPATWSKALFYTLLDSTTGAVGEDLYNYGFHVVRDDCKPTPSIACHSMKLYESKLANRLPPIPKNK